MANDGSLNRSATEEARAGQTRPSKDKDGRRG